MKKYHVHMSVNDFRTTVEAKNPDEAVLLAIQRCEQGGDVGSSVDIKRVHAEGNEEDLCSECLTLPAEDNVQ